MSTEAVKTATQHPLALPGTLVRQFADFRSAVRFVKGVEAIGGATVGVSLAWLALFLLDRFVDTPPLARLGLLVAAGGACAAVPVALHRWFWGLRGTERLARLVARSFPSLGDQLLGVVELVGSQGDPQRSRVLCEAAIAQVAAAAARTDLRAAVPHPRHRLWFLLAASAIVPLVALAAFTPEAAGNAWRRLLGPWRAIERFTFARIEPIPDPLVVPHGEAVDLRIALADGSRWRPARAAARFVGGAPLASARDGDAYRIPLPAQVAERRLRVAVGDARARVTVVPTHRPEIRSLEARVTLPDYLGITTPRASELRGGGLSVVRGSRVAVTATADRDLSAASVDGVPIEPVAASIPVPEVTVEDAVKLAFEWEDRLGLAGAKPLSVALSARDDEPPSITVAGLGGKSVLLESETVRFTAAARDDFGVMRVGLEWSGNGAEGAAGETLLAAGGPEIGTLDATGTFSPEALGIPPQTVEVRAFVEDALPGRGRIRSAATTFIVMNASDHALWVNDQIGRWRQQAAEVRDREMELLARNEELAAMSADDLDAPEMRRALREQAAGERSNGRRLSRLAASGAELVRQAMRNGEFDADTLEELAEHVATMEEMAATRMPGVGELLEAASDASRGDSPEPAGSQAPAEPAGSDPAAPPPRVGEDRRRPGTGEGARPPQPGAPSAPQVVDGEATHAKGDGRGGESGAEGGAGRLGLPTTTVGSGFGGGAGGRRGNGTQRPLLEEAVARQRQLVEDFAAIARQLADVMARLEGTTFVKRLKAASRNESKVGEGLATAVAGIFGRATRPPDDAGLNAKVDRAAKGNDEVGRKLSVLMDDLDAYAERRPLPAIRTVLDEMRDLDVLGNLRQLTDEMRDATGVSIARSEFWSDTFDRWADELVPPPREGGGGQGPPPESLPPEVVLEAMQILEAETNLREETRVVEQVRPSIGADEHAGRGERLAGIQAGLARRVAGIVEKLSNMPDGPTRFADEIERMRRDLLPRPASARRFAREIALFRSVEGVMEESRGILASPDTGRRAIAAQTEVIELLLQSQFGGGGGGGGGGSAPGGGGGGSTRDSALARLGDGINARARLEAPEEEQAVGRSGRDLPEEFRDGLDAYFNALERGSGPGGKGP